MAWLYPPQVTDGTVAADTYWHRRMAADALDGAPGIAPLDGDVTCEVAVIGAGLTGLAAALELAEQGVGPVHVLDSGSIGWGASGRGAGICGPHPAGVRVETLLKRHGPRAVRAYMDIQRHALDSLMEFAGASGLDPERMGDGFMEVAHDPETFERLVRRSRIFRDLLGIETQVRRPDEFAEVGFVSDEQCGAIHYRFGFGVNPLALTLAMAHRAAQAGTALHPHSRVTRWTGESGSGHLLATERGTVRARIVVMAGGGYWPDNLCRGLARRMMPVLTNVLVTRKLTSDELQEHAWSLEEPCITTAPDEPFFRLLPDRSFLFGACGGIDGTPGDEEKTREWLIWRMGRMFPSWKTFEVMHFWRGLAATTSNRTPALGWLDSEPGVFYAFGDHGFGFASAAWAGRFLARAIAGDAEEAFRRLPPPLRGPAPAYGWPDPRKRTIRRNYRRSAF